MARILVVEDDPTNRGLLREVLTGFGHEVVEASDGREALKALSGVEMVFTDFKMPGMDGGELVAAIRAMGAMGRSLPIVVVTGLVMAPTVAGADALLHKPFRSEEIDGLLSRFLQAGTARATPA